MRSNDMNTEGDKILERIKAHPGNLSIKIR